MLSERFGSAFGVIIDKGKAVNPMDKRIESFLPMFWRLRAKMTTRFTAACALCATRWHPVTELACASY